MTNSLENSQPVSKQSLQSLVDYIVRGYWSDSGELAEIASTDPEERKDTHYIDGNPREEREFTYQIFGFSEDRVKLIESAVKIWEDVADITFRRIDDKTASDTVPNITFLSRPTSVPEAAGENDGFAWGDAIVNVPDNSSNFEEARARLTMSDEELRETYGYSDEEIKEVRKLDEKTIDIVAETSDLSTIVHEIGHALGLGHPGMYNGKWGVEAGAIFENDKSQMSIMSYAHETQFDGTQLVPITPQMADIQAIQYLYGAAETRIGDTTYGFNVDSDDFPKTENIYDLSKYGNLTSFTIYDSGGIDELDVSGFDDSQTIDLRGGTLSDIGGKVGNIGIYIDTVIEHASGGSGNNTIGGNEVHNALYGNGGNDELYGLGGGDTLFGDGLAWSAVGGNDTLDGGDRNDVLYGMAGDDILIGGSGEDRLLGFAGDDVLEGCAGADSFIFELHQNTSISCWGNDVIKDFKDGDDKLVFQGGPADIDDLVIDIWSEGGTRISFNDHSVTLKGYYGMPDSNDFVFIEPTVIA